MTRDTNPGPDRGDDGLPNDEREQCISCDKAAMDDDEYCNLCKMHYNHWPADDYLGEPCGE